MAAAEVRVDVNAPGDNEKDVDMGGDVAVDLEEAEGMLGGTETLRDESIAAASKPRFVDYLRSPIIEICVGSGDSTVNLFAHEALLTQSPFFSDQISSFAARAPRRVSFPDEDLEAMGAFLQFLYSGEYYPRRLGESQLEGKDSADDEDGTELLRHARVYTLAEKLGVNELKRLAHSKVHRVNSSAKGEIAYAKYVYANTPRGDSAIRKPIASFWGQRSHVLRHQAEADFRALCIEYPDFGFDVLSYVLDQRERRSQKDAGDQEVPRSARKRARHT